MIQGKSPEIVIDDLSDIDRFRRIDLFCRIVCDLYRNSPLIYPGIGGKKDGKALSVLYSRNDCFDAYVLVDFSHGSVIGFVSDGKLSQGCPVAA